MQKLYNCLILKIYFKVCEYYHIQTILKNDQIIL